MRTLAVIGGMRIGDTFMAAPGIRAVAEKNGGIVDVAYSTFQDTAIKFLRDFTDIPIGETYCIPDGKIPADWNCIHRFKELGAVQKLISGRDHWVALDNKYWGTGNSCQIDGWARALGVFDIEDREIRVTENGPQRIVDEGGKPFPYIVVQLDTISRWKRQHPMVTALYPLPIVSLGLKGEDIMPGSIDRRGVPWSEIANIIRHATIFVGIASSLTKLASMVGQPTLMVHFPSSVPTWCGAGIGSRGEDLITPTTEQITETVRRMYDEI